jgi:hypothetical protein
MINIISCTGIAVVTGPSHLTAFAIIRNAVAVSVDGIVAAWANVVIIAHAVAVAVLERSGAVATGVVDIVYGTGIAVVAGCGGYPEGKVLDILTIRARVPGL